MHLHATEPRYSVVCPVYANRDSLEEVMSRLESLARDLCMPFEVVFVVDGSPDDSLELLQSIAERSKILVQVLAHSRNFGSFAAIRTGLAAARGEFIGVMAADLQEPPELMRTFFRQLEIEEVDVVVGRRASREDASLSSRMYWRIYRSTVMSDIPPGGVDVFAVRRSVAHTLLELNEAHSSLVGQLFWIGYRRSEVPYHRAARARGQSGWTRRKKWSYLADSIFSFTDLPIRLLTWLGAIGTLLSVLISVVVVVARWIGAVRVEGYTPLMLVILLCTFLLLLGLGIVGSYIWRVFENTKSRPLSIVASQQFFPRRGDRG